MPQQDQFRLDPVETKITAPISDVSVQQTPTNDTGLQAGVTALSQAMGSLADFAKKRRIQEDTLIAEEAAAREEVMPGGLLPVAQSAYHNVVDINTKAEVLASVKLWTEGDDYLGVIKSDATSREKSDALKNKFASFKAEGMAAIRNPALLQSFNLEMNELQAAQEKIIYEIEKKDMTVETIQGIKNVITDAKNFAEITDAKELADIFNKRWINAMGLDVKKTLPWITDKEARLLAMQTLMQDEDILLRPDIIHDMLGEEYSKGFTYSALLIGTGDDAEEFQKMHKDYLSDSNALFSKLSKEETASFNKRVDEAKDNAYDLFAKNGASLEAAAQARILLNNSGVFNKDKIETQIRAFENYYNSTERYGRNSEPYTNLVGRIVKNDITTKGELNDALLAAEIDTSLWDDAQQLFSDKGAQRKARIKEYRDKTSEMRTQMVSTIKMALKNNKNLSAILKQMQDSKLDNAQMLELIANSGLNASEFANMMEGLQIMTNNMNQLATDWGTEDVATDAPIRGKEFFETFRQQRQELLDAAKKISEITREKEASLLQDRADTKMKVEGARQKREFASQGFQVGSSNAEWQEGLTWRKAVKKQNDDLRKQIIAEAKAKKLANQKLIEKVPVEHDPTWWDNILDWVAPSLSDRLLKETDQKGGYGSFSYNKEMNDDEKVYFKSLLEAPPGDPIVDPKFEEAPSTKEIEENVDYQNYLKQLQRQDNTDRTSDRHKSWFSFLDNIDYQQGANSQQFKVTNINYLKDTEDPTSDASKMVWDGFQLNQNNVTMDQFRTTWVDVKDSIGHIESDNRPDRTQNDDPQGYGRGKFQYEDKAHGGSGAAETAVTRSNREMGTNITEMDFSKLSEEEQDDLLMVDHSQTKGSSKLFSDIVHAQGDDAKAKAIAKYWGKVHKKTATDEEIADKAEKIKTYLANKGQEV